MQQLLFIDTKILLFAYYVKFKISKPGLSFL